MRHFAAASLLMVATLAATHADDPAPSRAPGEVPRTTEAPASVPESPAQARPLAVGDKAPGAKVIDADGNDVELASAFAGRPTLLIFYRGGWCPFCTAHLAQVASVRAELERLGVGIVAVSPESAAHVKENAEKGGYGFRLLGDPDGAALRAYRVAFRLDDATAAKYREYGVDLQERSGGRAHQMLPVPAAFLIDGEGRIRFAHSDPDYRKRVDPQALLEAARSLPSMGGDGTSG